MRRACLAVLCLLLLGAELPLAGQIGYPGQYPGRYPGGGYPPGTYPPGGGTGIPFPRRGKQSKTSEKDNPAPTKEIEGILRKLDDKALVVEASDTRVITVKRTDKTKFLKDGDAMKPADLKPGDHLRIGATEDEQGYLYAVEVNFEKAGTAAERAAASEPVSMIDTGGSEGDRPAERRSGGANEPSVASDDPERPVLRRKDPPAESAKAEPPAPASTPGSQPDSAPAASQTKPPAKPETEANSDTPPSVADILKEPAPPAAPRDPDDPGPPKLKYGKPPRRATSDPAPSDDSNQSARPVQVASSREPASASVPAAGPIANPDAPLETRPAPPRAPEATQHHDAVIEKAREKAGEFTETLPDYVCTEFMARFVNTTHTVNWQPQDVVSTEVVYEHGRERYRNVTVNNKPKKSIEETGGAWSTGEFGTVLIDLFHPATDAAFRYRRESFTAGKTSLVYDFEVRQPNSHWNIIEASQTYRPAYRGTVWIDKRTYRVLRIEMQASHFPGDFPLDKVESATDYDYVRFGSEQQFLMPVHAETLSCQRGTNLCAMNKIDFRNYHKYTGESTITFGSDQPENQKPPK